MNRSIKISIVIFLCGWLLIACFEHYLMSCKNTNLHQWLYPKLYQGSFDAKAFPCRKSRLQEYQQLVARGYQSMKQKRLVICGLARDCEHSLLLMMNRIEETGALFKDYRVLIFENDSKDETRNLLKQWEEKNKKVSLLTCEVPDCKFKERPLYEWGACHRTRMEKMAYFRNKYLSVVYEQLSDFDYMMVVDMDIKGPWNLDGMASSFGYNNWDAIFANGLHTIPYLAGLRYGMYDAAAYVKYGGDYTVFNSYGSAVKNYFRLNFIECSSLCVGDPLIRVSSAFGGLGLYSIKSLSGCFYSGELCEHAALHKKMAEKGHDLLYINPSLIILSGHQGPPNLFDFIKRVLPEKFFKKS